MELDNGRGFLGKAKFMGSSRFGDHQMAIGTFFQRGGAELAGQGRKGIHELPQ